MATSRLTRPLDQACGVGRLHHAGERHAGVARRGGGHLDQREDRARRVPARGGRAVSAQHVVDRAAGGVRAGPGVSDPQHHLRVPDNPQLRGQQAPGPRLVHDLPQR